MSSSASMSVQHAGRAIPKITILKRTRDDVPFSQKKFLKKTKKGQVYKVLRERYLRDDIPCGYAGCKTCSAFPGYQPTLPLVGYTSHTHFTSTSGHFLLLDTNIILHQIDLIVSLPAGIPLIIPSTVVKEVRHRSLPLHGRLMQLVGDEDRSVWVFWNEERRETVLATEGEDAGVQGESPNDRNDRAIRQTVQFYTTHLSSLPTRQSTSTSHPALVLLTDDKNNRLLANQAGLNAVGTREYISGLADVAERDRLGDLVAGGWGGRADDVPEGGEGEGEGRLRKGKMYEEYLSQEVLQAGLSRGVFHQGYFNASQYNYLEGTVNTHTLPGKPILLSGRTSINRAIQGDSIVIQLLPEDQWKSPGTEVVDQDEVEGGEDAGVGEDEDEEGREAGVGVLRKSEVEGRVEIMAEKVPTGKVVGVLKRNWRAYVCHLDRTSLSDVALTSLSQQTVFATPVDRKLPRIRLRTRQAPTLVDQKFLVSIDAWPASSRYPEGHFVRALGKVESKEAEQESLLLEYEVPYRPFGKAILDCLPVEGQTWVVPPKDSGHIGWRDREDLRDLLVCSIDPPGCTDIDDALHARELPNGNIEAGVHIADVSHFVHPDNAMDAEAAARGTTVYLVDKRIDMLPELLGTNLCSLRPFVERFAFSAIWELNPEAEIVNVRYTKSVIASKMAFTYQAAQDRKDDLTKQDPLSKSVRLLNSLAIKLKAARIRAGALSLSSPEIKIHLDSNEGAPEPIDVEQKAMLETNSLVEEFMLLANISVAKKIQEAYPQTAVLRRHLPPPKTNFETLADILKKTRGFELDASSSKALAASLDVCVDSKAPEFNTLVRIMATRCMLAAEYFCSGSVSKDTFGHYGLASPIYTHFTSPIRRYADVLAHRQLAAAIGYTPLHPSLQSKAHVERILSVVNRRHRLAQMAGRASVEFYVGLALKARGVRAGLTNGSVTREDAFVIRTFRNGLAVFVSQLGLEGLVTFNKDTHDFDAENYRITIPGKKGKPVVISVFDKIVVDVSIEQDKNTQRGKVKMTMVEPLSSVGL